MIHLHRMFRVSLPPPSRRTLELAYLDRQAVLGKALHEVHRRIRTAATRDGLQPTVKYRVKRFDSLYEKILRRAREAGDAEVLELSDVLGLRVVCPFMEDIAHVEALIHAAFDVVEVERKGSHLSTTEFGYSSVHLLIRMPEDVCDSFHLDRSLVAEVQLRTILQDAWAEVEHELVYKAELTPLDDPLRRKLAALNANLSLSDIIFQEIRDYQRTMHAKLMDRRDAFWSEATARADADAAGGPGEAAPNGAAASGEPAARTATTDRRDHDDRRADAAGDRHDPTAASAGESAGDADRADDPFIETGSDTLDSMLLKALDAHNRKDYATADRLYTDILAYQPMDHIAAIIHAHRGMARYALGDADGAIGDFGATIRLSPATTKAYYYRAIVYRSRGRTDLALADLSRCLEYDPYHVESRVARARLYRDRGDLAAARADCAAARDIAPTDPSVAAICDELFPPASDARAPGHDGFAVGSPT